MTITREKFIERLGRAAFDEETTTNPHYADQRNFFKVQKWSRDGMHIVELHYAGSSLDHARTIFAATVKHRPRIRLTVSLLLARKHKLLARNNKTWMLSELQLARHPLEATASSRNARPHLAAFETMANPVTKAPPSGGVTMRSRITMDGVQNGDAFDCSSSQL
jgi:hypothetical protein